MHVRKYGLKIEKHGQFARKAALIQKKANWGQKSWRGGNEAPNKGRGKGGTNVVLRTALTTKSQELGRKGASEKKKKRET